MVVPSGNLVVEVKIPLAGGLDLEMIGCFLPRR